jgi:hypothetical protein
MVLGLLSRGGKRSVQAWDCGGYYVRVPLVNTRKVALPIHVRLEIPLDEDHAGREGLLKRPDEDEKAALLSRGAQKGMAQMSEKFKAMGNEVYVETSAVKETNRAL